MSENPNQLPKRDSYARAVLPTWFKISLLVLAVLIMFKLLQVEVFVEFELDGIPYLAGLTDIETYFIPLGILLIYILWSWIRHRVADSRKSRKQDGAKHG